METAENKYITVAYKLYTTEDGEKDLVEEAKAEHPFQFISGLGTTLEAFESQIAHLIKEINSSSPFHLRMLMASTTKNMYWIYPNIFSKSTANSITNVSLQVM